MLTTLLSFVTTASTAFAGYHLAIRLSWSPYWFFSPYWGGAIATGTLAAVVAHFYLSIPKTIAFVAMASTAMLAIILSWSTPWIFSPYWSGAIATGTLAAVAVHLYLPIPKRKR